MPHSDNRQHQQELQPVRHRIQHEHGGAEYRNRADGRHDKTGDEGANFRFRSARFARITEPDVWTAPFCAHCTPVSAEPDAWAPSAVARMSESPESDILAPTEPTAEPAAAPTLACFPGSMRNVRAACSCRIRRDTRPAGRMKRQRGRAEGGQRKIDPEIGEHDMRRAFAVFLAIEDQP